MDLSTMCQLEKRASITFDLLLLKEEKILGNLKGPFFPFPMGETWDQNGDKKGIGTTDVGHLVPYILSSKDSHGLTCLLLLILDPKLTGYTAGESRTSHVCPIVPFFNTNKKLSSTLN